MVVIERQLLVFANRTDRAARHRFVDGTFIGNRARSRLSLAIIAELEDRGDGGDAEAAANAKILVDFNFLSHDYFLQSGNKWIIG
jgi:hypothetical protein